jgi:hypothetical protein
MLNMLNLLNMKHIETYIWFTVIHMLKLEE